MSVVVGAAILTGNGCGVAFGEGMHLVREVLFLETRDGGRRGWREFGGQLELRG